MIKHFPTIYPEELFYSYISRMLCHSGFAWHTGISREVLKNPNACANFSFVNVLNREFRKELEKYISIKEVITKHTLFNFYAMFLPNKKKKEVYDIAIKNDKDLSFVHLPIPNNKRNYFLRYCPKCVKEDRNKYGECYFHVEHQIPEVKCCHIHGIRLLDTRIINGRSQVVSFIPLEMLVNNLEEIVCKDIEVEVAKYIATAMHQKLNLEIRYPIGSFLCDKLNNKYFPPRGEQKYLDKIMEDLQEFYIDLDNFNITKRRLATIYRNEYINVFDIHLIALFEGIKPQSLNTYKQAKQTRWESFDSKVKQLKAEGYNNAQIASKLNVNHEVVRQVLLGTYDKPKNSKPRFIQKRWNWEQIDKKSCAKLKQLIDSKLFNSGQISKKGVAKELNLKDGNLRNLPFLKEMIRKYKNQR